MFAIPGRVSTPWGQRISDFARGPLQVIAWLALGATGIVLTLSDSVSLEIPGIAVAKGYDLRAQRDGLIQQLHVSPGDTVRAGTVVATLDAHAHGLELSLARQRLAALSAEVVSTIANQRVAAATRQIDALRRDRQDIEEGLRRASDGEANRERTRDRAARLAIESRRLQLSLASMEADQVGRQIAARRARQIADRAFLVAKDGAGRLGSAKDLGLEADEIEASIKAFDLSIQQAQRQLVRSNEQVEAALASLAQLPAEGAEPAEEVGNPWSKVNGDLERTAKEADSAALESLERRLDVARAELMGMESQSATFEVLSPIDGRIIAVSVATGSAVLKGEALATVEPPHAEEIEVFMPERGAQDTIPKELLVARAVNPRETSRAEVIRVSDRLTRLPDALQLDPARVARGRAIYLRIPEDLSILSGERVLATQIGRDH